MVFSLRSLRLPFLNASTPPAVSCVANPMDLRPALDAITNEIQKRSGQGPLVVLTSERHDTPAHLMLQQALMGRFADPPGHPSAIACGLEMEHNQLETIIEKACRITLPTDVRGRMSAADTDSKNLFRAMRAIIMPAFAPASFRNRLAFLEAQSISLHLNDVANTGHCLNAKDGETRRLIERHAPQALNESIGFISPLGISLRNQMIVDNASAHCKQTNASIYFQNCGRSHLLGRNDEKHAFANSLTALFQQAGYNVLPVLAADSLFKMNLLSRDAKKALASGIVIEGMGAGGYGREHWSSERHHLATLREQSHAAFEIFPDMEPGFDTGLFAQLKQEAPAWVRAAQKFIANGPA